MLRMTAREGCCKVGNGRYKDQMEGTCGNMREMKPVQTVETERAEWPISTLLYAFGMGLLLIEYGISMFFYPTNPYHTGWWVVVLALRMGMTLAGVWMERKRRDVGFWILLVYFLLRFFRVFIPQPGAMADWGVCDRMFNAAWGFLGCYALGRVLDRQQLKTFLRVMAAAWVLLITIHSGIALYAAWRGEVIWNLSGLSYWGLAGTIGSGDEFMNAFNATQTTNLRLYVVFYVTTAGSVLSTAAVIGAGAMLACKRIIGKILYAIGIIVILLALSLTDSRGGYIAASAGFGVLALGGVLYIFKKKQPAEKTRKRTALAWCTAIACMVLVFGISLLVIAKTPTVVGRLRSGHTAMISTAYAEGSGGTTASVLANRGFDQSADKLLSDRPVIWKNVIRYLTEHPISLLTGQSMVYPMVEVNAQTDIPFNAGHCHCMPLQIVLENGLPALVLILVLLVYAAACMIRIFRKEGVPLWMHLVGAPVAAILTGELVECFTWVATYASTMPIFFMTLGMITGLGNRKALASDEAQRTEQPAPELAGLRYRGMWYPEAGSGK